MNNVTYPNLQTEIRAVSDHLLSLMGVYAYCLWFANALTGRGAWTDTAPLPEIRDLLQSKAAALLGRAPRGSGARRAAGAEGRGRRNEAI